MALASGSPVAQTAYQIICDAMYDAGKIGLGQEPTSEESATNMRRLNKYVNYLQTKGIKLFVQTDYSLQAPILQQGVGGQGNPYTFGPGGLINMTKPRRITEAYFVEPGSQTRRPLIIASRTDWDTFSTVTTQGTITQFYVDKQIQTLNLYLWNIPDAFAATGQVHVIIDQQIPNFASITDQMAFPPEWSLTLEWGLAHQLSTGQPQSVIDRCRENWMYYEAELCDWDVEDAPTRFEPDSRGLFVGRRFS